ncbi:hypothetical protein TWF225_010064 [Orbilia oligospora]|nr:hypothetical protein TWF225_010064 [Orbilia oligospora]
MWECTIAANREDTTLEPEVAMWWSLMITVAIGRYILRTTRKGLRFDAADWLTLLALLMWQMQMDLAHVNSHAVIAEHKSLWVRQSSRIQSKYFTSIVGFRPRIDKALENIRYPRMDWRNLQHYDTILGQRVLATCLLFPYKLFGLDGKGSELCGNCGNLYYYVPLIKMVENWVSGLRMKRASYRQAESPDIEQTPHPDMEEGGKSIEPCDAELTKGNEFMITKALGDNV